MNNEPFLRVVFFRSELGREPVRKWLREPDLEEVTVGAQERLLAFQLPDADLVVGK